MATELKKRVLHVGAGKCPIHPYFRDYEEIRLDLDPDCEPDLVGPMDCIPMNDMTVDAVYSSHALEHVPFHVAHAALREFKRVIMPGGMAFVVVPDVTAAAAAVAEGDPYRLMYESAGGPVRACDMIWGHKDWIARTPVGKAFKWAHAFGYTPGSLGQALEAAGFENVRTKSADYNAVAVGIA